jgi:hypothetical protein
VIRAGMSTDSNLGATNSNTKTPVVFNREKINFLFGSSILLSVILSSARLPRESPHIIPEQGVIQLGLLFG